MRRRDLVKCSSKGLKELTQKEEQESNRERQAKRELERRKRQEGGVTRVTTRQLDSCRVM